MKNSGGSVFPTIKSKNSDYSMQKLGLTIRDYFAGQALAGYLANNTVQCMELTEEVLAEASYNIADAMLAERDREA